MKEEEDDVDDDDLCLLAKTVVGNVRIYGFGPCQPAFVPSLLPLHCLTWYGLLHQMVLLGNLYTVSRMWWFGSLVYSVYRERIASLE